MATRLKTIEYWFPHLASAADASDTSFTQITVNIPESGKTFQEVYVEVTAMDVATTLSNVTTRHIDVQLGSAGYTSVDNTQTLTNSGEQFSLSFGQDFTSYFTTNWAGTSMTMDCRVNINTSTAGSRNLTARVIITYSYDDTSSTQIKTVYIPLDAPLTAPGATKPGSPIATIPALDDYCPESGKTYHQVSLCIQGNEEAPSNTTDITMSYEIDTWGAFTSGSFEQAANSSISFRIGNVLTQFSGTTQTSVTHSFYYWASLYFSHPQVWLTVTYSFNPVTSTRILNSLLLPMEFSGAMGSSATDFKRATRELWIQESGVTVQTCALYIFYEAVAAIGSLNARVGTGSFVSYSSQAATVCGSCALMIRNDSISLSRGRNTLQADIYRVDTLDPGGGLSSFWMINYHSDKHADGVGAHTHTILWNISPTGNVAANNTNISASTAIAIPESNYFITGLGTQYIYDHSGTINAGGVFTGVERLASTEGGLIWESIYESMNSSSPEIGIRWAYGQAREIFKRFPQDADPKRLDIETSRRYMNQVSTYAFHQLTLIMTYHAITYTVSGTISNSNGGTVNLYLHKSDILDVSNKGELMQISSRSGDGSYSFTVYDNTEDVFVSAYEDGTHIGRSAYGKAT